MYRHAKMTPAQIVPGIRDWGGGTMMEGSGGVEFKYDIFNTLLRTFVNAAMYPTQHNNIKKDRQTDKKKENYIFLQGHGSSL
jgi:hypothetical protein